MILMLSNLLIIVCFNNNTPSLSVQVLRWLVDTVCQREELDRVIFWVFQTMDKLACIL